MVAYAWLSVMKFVSVCVCRFSVEVYVGVLVKCGMVIDVRCICCGCLWQQGVSNCSALYTHPYMTCFCTFWQSTFSVTCLGRSFGRW